MIAECQSGATCHTVSGRQTPAGELDIDTAVACDTTSEHCYSLGEALANETTDVAGTVGSLPLEEAKDIASAFASHHGLIDSTPTDTYGLGESPVPHPEVPSQSDAGFMGVTDDYNAHYFDTIYYYFLAGSTVTTVGSYQSIVAIRLGLSMATSSRWQGGMAVNSGPDIKSTIFARCLSVTGLTCGDNRSTQWVNLGTGPYMRVRHHRILGINQHGIGTRKYGYEWRYSWQAAGWGGVTWTATDLISGPHFYLQHQMQVPIMRNGALPVAKLSTHVN